MIVKRACVNCDSTGLAQKGFCPMCKGVGYTEVISKVEEDTNYISMEEADLLQIVAKHTDSSQFTKIINEYVQ